MDKSFWNVYCLVLGITIDGGQFNVSSIYQQLRTWSILREPIVVVEGLKIKLYLFGDVGYASWNYLLCNFKLVNGNLDKIMFDQQINVGRVSIENAFGILKNRWRILHCINAHVDQAPRILMACCVFSQLLSIEGLPPPPRGLQKDPLCCARRQVLLFHESQVTSQHGEEVHIAFFTNWMIIYTNPIWCSSWAFWKYRCITSKILLYWFEIWNTSA